MILLAPRGTAKSTAVSVNFPLWMIGGNREIRILLISNTASQAQGFLRSIKFTLESDEYYRQIYGRVVPEGGGSVWTQSSIIVDRDTKEKDQTISAVGAGGAILSKRADIVIADDILNKDNTRTPEQRQKIKEWWKDVVMPVLDPINGKVFYISTVWHPKDLSHELMKDPTYDYKKIYKSILQEPTRQDLWDAYRDLYWSSPTHGKKLAEAFYKEHEEVMMVGSKVLWPERWNYKTLFDEKLSVGSRSFALAYQNEAIDDESALFKRKWVESCYDDSKRLLTHFDQSQDVWEITIRTQGVDLASSEKETSDLRVVLTLGLNRSNKFVLMNAIYGRWSPAVTRNNIVDQGERFDPTVILVESNGFQRSMVKDSQEMSSLPIQGFETTGEKFDQEIGIEGLAVAFENGQFILPSDPTDPHTTEVLDALTEELVSYRHDSHAGDILMALWFAWTGIRKYYSFNEPQVIDADITFEGVDIDGDY